MSSLIRTINEHSSLESHPKRKGQRIQEYAYTSFNAISVLNMEGQLKACVLSGRPPQEIKQAITENLQRTCTSMHLLGIH